MTPESNLAEPKGEIGPMRNRWRGRVAGAQVDEGHSQAGARAGALCGGRGAALPAKKESGVVFLPA